VPRELIDRPKMGFAIPLADWLRGDLAHLVDEHLDAAEIRRAGVLDPDLVQRTVRLFRGGDQHATSRLWSLLAFQMWYRRWMN
jgi:asparagine synthase (glutamine-hydrolysing)